MNAELLGQVPEKTYDASFRCDRCGAQAVGEVHMSTGVLYFCGHHGRAYLPALAAMGVEVIGKFAQGGKF